jgi:hypothetical protein
MSVIGITVATKNILITAPPIVNLNRVSVAKCNFCDPPQ